MVYKVDDLRLRAQIVDLTGNIEDGPVPKAEKVVRSAQQLDKWLGEQDKAFSNNEYKNGKDILKIV